MQLLHFMVKVGVYYLDVVYRRQIFIFFCNHRDRCSPYVNGESWITWLGFFILSRAYRKDACCLFSKPLLAKLKQLRSWSPRCSRSAVAKQVCIYNHLAGNLFEKVGFQVATSPHGHAGVDVDAHIKYKRKTKRRTGSFSGSSFKLQLCAV